MTAMSEMVSMPHPVKNLGIGKAMSEAKPPGAVFYRSRVVPRKKQDMLTVATRMVSGFVRCSGPQVRFLTRMFRIA